MDDLVVGVCVFDLFSGDCFALGNGIDDFFEGRNAVTDHLVALDELGQALLLEEDLLGDLLEGAGEEMVLFGEDELEEGRCDLVLQDPPAGSLVGAVLKDGDQFLLHLQECAKLIYLAMDEGFSGVRSQRFEVIDEILDRGVTTLHLFQDTAADIPR